MCDHLEPWVKEVSSLSAPLLRCLVTLSSSFMFSSSSSPWGLGVLLPLEVLLGPTLDEGKADIERA